VAVVLLLLLVLFLLPNVKVGGACLGGKSRS
jgi:hypothetical protein